MDKEKESKKDEVRSGPIYDFTQSYFKSIHLPYSIVNEGIGDRIEIFIPTYMCIVVKALDSMDHEKMTVRVTYTFILRICLTGLSKASRSYIRKNLAMRLGEESVDIPEEFDKEGNCLGVKCKMNGDIMSITLRDTTEVFCNPDFHDTPFDRHRVKLRFEMTSIADREDGKTFNYRFNCFRYKDPVYPTQVSFKAECDRLPEFNIAANKTIVLLPLELKQEDVDPSRTDNLQDVAQNYFQKLKGEKPAAGPPKYRELYRYYPITTFSLLIYREPESMILLSSLPLLLLNLFTISVFGLRDDEYGDKLATLVTLILALFAFLPTLRDQIPMVPYTTLLEKQIFLSVGIQALALLEAVINSQLPSDVEDPLQLKIKYGFLGLSVAAALFNIFVFLIYYIKRKRAFRNYTNPGEHVKELDENKDYTDDELVKAEEETYRLRSEMQKKVQGADFKEENRLQWINLGLQNYSEQLAQANKTKTMPSKTLPSTSTTSTSSGVTADLQVTGLDV